MTVRERIPSNTGKGSMPVPERLKALNENQSFAVLATSDKDQPYTSIISFAITPDLKTVIFATPEKTQKFKNILDTGKVAVMIDNRAGTRKKLMATEAITIIGRARHVPRGKTWGQTRGDIFGKTSRPGRVPAVEDHRASGCEGHPLHSCWKISDNFGLGMPLKR